MCSPRKVTFSIVLIVLVTIITAARSHDSHCPKKCTYEENTVWSTDGDKCIVWRNDCSFEKMSCERKYHNKKVMKKISKSECQKMCHHDAPKISRPLCAEYNGVERTFKNSRIMVNHMCETGETYIKKHGGSCKE